MTRWLICFSLLAGAAVCLQGDDRETAPAPLSRPRPHAKAPELAGKAVAITIKSDPTYGIYLDQTQVVELGHSSFLVGTGLDSGAGEWTAGRRIWVAIDDISEIIEFDSADDLRKSLEPEDERPDA